MSRALRYKLTSIGSHEKTVAGVDSLNNIPSTTRVVVIDFEYTIDLTPLYSGGLQLAVRGPDRIPATAPPAEGSGLRKLFSKDHDKNDKHDKHDKHDKNDKHDRPTSLSNGLKVHATAPKPMTYNKITANPDPNPNSAADLEKWVAAFLADPEKNKALVLDKTVGGAGGWDMKAFQDQLTRWVRETGYNGNVEIHIAQTIKSIVVRPASRARRVWQRVNLGPSEVKTYHAGLARCRSYGALRGFG